MGIALALLKRFWWLIPVGIAIGTIGFQHIEIGHLEKKTGALQVQVRDGAATIAQLQQGISAQNAGVERILQQGFANEKAAAQEAKARTQAAQRVKVIYQTRVERIEAAPVPATCESAAAWAAQQAQGLSAGWSK